ncbi:betaine-aldehyde dehydrogenase [Zavarzinia sp. CC-PAN008]|uniref:betaine-aldehyde dehydrogenase n=1 Tax=Zavarzinia sp. CC-PAN008 TaxID=3243332 RepID=UPI003F749D20
MGDSSGGPGGLGLPDQELHIGGVRVAARSGVLFDNLNPATAALLCRVHMADAGDVSHAVAAAQAALGDWRRRSGMERGRILRRAADILRARNAEIARLEVLDTGKPISEAIAVDVLSGADALEYFGSIAAGLTGEHIDLGQSFVYTRREALGVCVGIGAWNYPIQIACWKAAPALACGNTMVFKPSELTPVTALCLADALTEAGLPPGVFNVVQGDHRTGQALVRHPGVAKVSLTGEVGTGRTVMREAAATLKHVTMELGGKSPLIVFADADLDNAVTAAMLANFYTQGEVCSNGTRVFVEEGLRDRFVEALVARVKLLKVGDPLDPATHVGALISQGHMERVLDFVAEGERQGARLAVGGARAPDLPGWFVAPAVFDHCTDDMRIVREEIFGPVMSVLSFTSEREVLSRANGTEFGLSAGVFTRDLQRGHRLAAELEAGMVWLNTYNVTPVEMPFGGVKQSGLGRENGHAAIAHYSQLKSVYVELGDVANPYPVPGND